MLDTKYFIKSNSTINQALIALEKCTPINTLLVISEKNRKLIGIITDGDIRRSLIAESSVSDPISVCINKNFLSINHAPSKEEILKLFDTRKYKLIPVIDKQGCVQDVITIDTLTEKFDRQYHSVSRSIAPVRVSFGGGGSDLTEYFVKSTGAVLNSTIQIYARSTLKKRFDSKVNIYSHDLEKSISYDSNESITKEDKDFSLILAVIETINPDFGFDLEIKSDFPIGSGLGGSSSVCVSILGCFNEYRIEKWDNYQISEYAFQAERINLGIAGGWQDQYAAAFGGFNYMEFNSSQNIVHPLRIGQKIVRELEYRCVLCYTDIQRESHSIHAATVSKKSIKVNDARVKMKKNTQRIKNSLLRGDLEEFGFLLNENWLLKKEYSPDSTNNQLDKIYNFAISYGAHGGKLLGAGGGGYFLFISGRDGRFQLERALEGFGLKVSNLKFEDQGLQSWKLYSDRD